MSEPEELPNLEREERDFLNALSTLKGCKIMSVTKTEDDKLEVVARFDTKKWVNNVE